MVGSTVALKHVGGLGRPEQAPPWLSGQKPVCRGRACSHVATVRPAPLGSDGRTAWRKPRGGCWACSGWRCALFKEPSITASWWLFQFCDDLTFLAKVPGLENKLLSKMNEPTGDARHDHLYPVGLIEASGRVA